MASTAAKVKAQELHAKMDALKQDFADFAETARDRAVKGTMEWVKEHPLAAVGIIAGGAFLIGFMVGRK